MNIQKAGIGAALPLLLNPATLGFVAIGAIGWGLFNLLRDDEEVSCEQPSSTVQKSPTIPEVVDAEATPTPPDVSQATAQLESALQPGDEPETHSVSDECAAEAEQRQMIRQAMSELGKRSAAARAKRKAAAFEGAQVAT